MMDDKPDDQKPKEPVNVLVEVVRLNQVANKQRQMVVESKIQDQEHGRRLAAKYADEMLLGMVTEARTHPDADVRFKCRKYIIDRAWGTAKPLTEEEKKGADGGSLLDILAAASTMNGDMEITIRNQKAVEKEEKDITLAIDIDGFFEEIDKANDND